MAVCLKLSNHKGIEKNEEVEELATELGVAALLIATLVRQIKTTSGKDNKVSRKRMSTTAVLKS
ncbi:hypothetical protein ALTER154_80195 [Alteromonas sp. 154]|nr:hypothetical protein ALTER154_80195 [Alteromonas sp. 154]